MTQFVNSMELMIVVSLTWTAGQTLADDVARIEVTPSEEIGPVNRLILGNSITAAKTRRYGGIYADRGAGVWDPEQRCPVPEFVRLAKQAGISVWRWAPGRPAFWNPFVGPLEKRDFKFGLPEFLTFCEQTNSVPIILMDVWGSTPDDAADLVEYLNSPNDGSNPNGGTDWAAVRAAGGHPAPYDVVWFECGNESYVNAGKTIEKLGIKGGYQGLAEEYGRRYLQFRAAMKAVDPRIELGANIQHTIDPWNKPVLRITGKQIDFAIDHTYLPAFGRNTTPDMSRLIMQACVACGAQVQEFYDDLNELVKQETGRTDLPWAITEYNGLFTQEEPVPYRQTLGNALNIAEHIRVMMQPRNRIALATFWNFANEYWGMVRGYTHKGEQLIKQSNFYVFQLYNEHFGDTLIASRGSCGHWGFPGGAGVRPRAVPDLSVNAAKRADGTITLMIVNTNMDADIQTTIVPKGWRTGAGSRAAAWSLVGATPWATNLGPKPEVRLIETPIRKAADGWQITLPRHSLTAVEIHP